MMRKQKLLLVLIIISCLPSYGQDTADFKTFITKFNTSHLDSCTTYTVGEMAFINPCEFDTTFSDEEDYKNDSLILTEEEIHTFLLSMNDTISIQNIWSLDTVDTELIYNFLDENTYYAGRVIYETPQFIGITYEILNHIHGSEKYFCTMDKKGKFISCILVGFYLHTGSYTTDSGGRNWWYSSHASCFQKNKTITKYNQNSMVNGVYEVISKYSIIPRGEIMEIK